MHETVHAMTHATRCLLDALCLIVFTPSFSGAKPRPRCPGRRLQARAGSAVLVRAARTPASVAASPASAGATTGYRPPVAALFLGAEVLGHRS